MNEAVEYGITSLLEMTGARIHGRNRADCPDCKRPRAVSFTDTAFYCHGIDCEFHGGIGTLRKRLGIGREWLPKAEYIRQCRERERAHDAAERLCAAARARRFVLYDELGSLNRIEAGAHRAGPCEAAWSALAMVYAGRPRILAELAVLENSRVTDLVEFLAGGAEAQARAIDSVLLRGGMTEAQSAFVEVPAL